MIWYDMIHYHIILNPMIHIRHLVNSKHTEKHTRIPWPTSAGWKGSLLTRIFGNPHWCLRKIQTNSLHCEVLALLGVFWCLKDAVQITLIVLVAGLVTIAGGLVVPIGWMRIFEGIFSSGDPLDDMVPTPGRPNLEQKGCRSQLHEVVRIPDPFIHPELASPWPDSSKLQAPSEVACSQSFWLENWSENDDHQNQSQWRTRHRFALCTHVMDRWLANKCNKDSDRARDKEFGLQSCNHVCSLLHDYYLNSWEPPLGTMASCDVRKCSNATQDTTSKSWEFSQIWMVHCTKRL